MMNGGIFYSNGIDNAFKYAGEVQDEETGLYYLRARYYDPAVGRFVSKDTYEGQIKNPLSLNLYTYVENNPSIYTDPTGYWCTATVNGKYYSHPGKCNGSGNGQDYIPDENATNFGRTIYDAGVSKGKWYPEGAFYIKGDKTGITDAIIGCANDKQCLGFVGGAVTEASAAYNGVKSGVSKGINVVKGLVGNNKGTDETAQKSGSLKLDLQQFAKNKFPTGSVSGKDVVKFLKKEGFDVVSQNGSHVKLNGPNGEVVIVPVHGNKSLPSGTLNSIKKQAGYK